MLVLGDREAVNAGFARVGYFSSRLVGDSRGYGKEEVRRGLPDCGKKA